MPASTVAQSALHPASAQAASLEWLWWFIFWICTAVMFAVMAFLAAAVLRRKDRETPESTLQRVVIASAAGTVVVLFVWLIASLVVGRVYALPETSDAVTINVTGRQWWWQVEYVDPIPANRFRTANELIIPVGRPVVVNLTSRDVVHSFWVPNLQGKRDLIPGYVSSIWFQADREGMYRGQCAEFCGYQHANMAMFVTARNNDQYEEWLRAQRQPAIEPVTDVQQKGRDVFLRKTCVQCHAIRGTIAGATLGPDLTHVGSRATIATGLLPNTVENLKRWVRNPQAFKPGNRMPPHDLSDEDLQALAEYLRSLK
jgi:cytochrome c oxidase subunit 2